MVKRRYRLFKVEIHQELCGDAMSCRLCLEKCPQSVFTTYPKGGKRKKDKKSTWIISPGFAAVCDGCGICIDLCPRNAITVSPRK